MKGLRGQLLEQEPMARHTSWRVGGPAQRYYKPTDAADLARFIAQLPTDEPITWVGLGSNLLVRDGGIRGSVIATQGALTGLELLDRGQIRAEAGVACAHLARFAVKNGLCGLEFLAGIPGTVGGALRMNAGAFGGETWQRLLRVETLDRQGQMRQRPAEEYQVGYRSVSGPAEEWFLAGVWQLEAGDAESGMARIKTLLEQRAASQPTSQPSCGSVFRNPPGDHAARLIEQCGLKGKRVGGACVSDKHANFIVNTGNARAEEIETLMEQVREQVQRQFGLRLESEVHILGEPK
ncbi:UDP-N-acetylmuramate dehydrogenase [Magnetovirga frankeli]|uniref:UDP-N-acetylmuramate dehydrogenase n=1 Tax=Magnetovirga frankeli TaxID=947516 RepID=UPI001293FAFB|nr:UDP-N-acetylmuramate dehydrogenase [gamma proteobacterium SS-5]